MSNFLWRTMPMRRYVFLCRMTTIKYFACWQRRRTPARWRIAVLATIKSMTTKFKGRQVTVEVYLMSQTKKWVLIEYFRPNDWMITQALTILRLRYNGWILLSGDWNLSRNRTKPKKHANGSKRLGAVALLCINDSSLCTDIAVLLGA